MSLRVRVDAFSLPTGLSGGPSFLCLRIATAIRTEPADDPAAMGTAAVTALAAHRAADGDAGEIFLALNLLSAPSERLPFALLQEIVKSGSDAAREAGFPILGGHTLDLDTTLYGVMTVEAASKHETRALAIPETSGAYVPRPVMGYAQVHGCGAKLPPDRLAALLPSIAPHAGGTRPMLASDDAVVLDLGQGVALAASIDVITPITNDPAAYAEIAVAGCFSDLYAKGSIPRGALAVLGAHPRLDVQTRATILATARTKAASVGALLCGIHEVPSEELFFGLLCVGTGDARHALPKTAVRPGDRLVLTKAIGTGIISTVEKRTGLRGEDEVRDRTRKSMAALNDVAAATIFEVGGASAVTDVTGFGLVGHLLEMLGAGMGARLYARSVPLLCREKLLGYLASGLDFCSMNRNRHFLEAQVRISGEATREGDDRICDALFDAQTSGGLLVAVAADRAERLVWELRRRGVVDATIIGVVQERTTSEPLQIVLDEAGA